MNALKTLTVTALTGAAAVAGSVGYVHAQRPGTMMRPPVVFPHAPGPPPGFTRPQTLPMVPRPTGTTPRPNIVTTTTATTTKPTTSTTVTMGSTVPPPFRHHHRHVVVNNYYSMNPYASGGYGLPYGGYSNGYGYNASSTAAYSSAYRESPPEDTARPPTPLESLVHSVNDPQPGEITSGKALNAILADLQKIAATMNWEGLPAVNLPITPEALEHVNVTQGAGNFGILKQGNRLTWPAAFGGPDFDEQRAEVEAILQTAINQVWAGEKVDPDTFRNLTDATVRMDKQIKQLAAGLDFETHTEAKTFIRNLDAAIVALQQPDARENFTGRYKLTAKTVFALVRQMADNKLQFAAALPGDEAIYTALHQTLAAYDRNLRPQAPSETQTPAPSESSEFTKPKKY